jgi:hypothetical protein
MSAITWTAEAPTGSPISANALNTWARRLWIGVGLVMATSTAYAGILLTVLMASGIVQV